MKVIFSIVIFSFICTLSFAQVFKADNSFLSTQKNITPHLLLQNKGYKSTSADSLIPLYLIDINMMDLFIRNFNINYEWFFKNKNSIECGIGWKVAYRPNGKIPVIPPLLFDPVALEYLGSDGYNINGTYKWNLSRKNLGTYLGIGAFYRYAWYNNKLIDLSYDGTSHGGHLYWQSASHHIAGLNLIFGKRFFLRGNFYFDFFLGAGIKLNDSKETLYQDYNFGAYHYYNPPRIYNFQKTQPSVQAGFKIGVYKNRR
jgi:hypothetical protein